MCLQVEDDFQQQALEFQQETPSSEVSVIQQQLPQLLPERIGFIGAGQVLHRCVLVQLFIMVPSAEELTRYWLIAMMSNSMNMLHDSGT